MFTSKASDCALEYDQDEGLLTQAERAAKLRAAGRNRRVSLDLGRARSQWLGASRRRNSRARAARLLARGELDLDAALAADREDDAVLKLRPIIVAWLRLTIDGISRRANAAPGAELDFTQQQLRNKALRLEIAIKG